MSKPKNSVIPMGIYSIDKTEVHDLILSKNLVHIKPEAIQWDVDYSLWPTPGTFLNDNHSPTMVAPFTLSPPPL
jgi:hypothetical protein